MKGTTRFVGLDVSKETLAVAVAEEGREGARYWGTIANRPEEVRKLVQKLGQPEDLMVAYEAGPTGYGLHRQLSEMGIVCVVAAPTLIPRQPGNRVKTDRRDALRLAELLRAGELTPVGVPDEEDEALRDLVRAREDAIEDRLQARHRISKFLLRHGIVAPRGMARWGSRFRIWLSRVHFDRIELELTLAEYLQALDAIDARIGRLEKAIHDAAERSRHAPVIRALQSLRGIGELTAVTAVSEVGSFERFPHPARLMAFTGIVPSEHSSGGSRWQGGITKTGNAHLRRVVVEAAWAYRHAPRNSEALRRRARDQSAEIQAMAWKAQVRLSSKYRRLVARGKPSPVALVAVARELLGFLWAVACQAEKEQREHRAKAA
jgi:transposase